MKSYASGLFSGLIVMLLASACAEMPVARQKTTEPVGTNGTNLPAAPAVAKPKPASSPILKQVQTQFSQGNSDVALDQIEATQEIELSARDRSDLWNIRGLILLKQRKLAESQRSFQKAIETNPVPANRPYLQYNLASAYVEDGRNLEAEQILDTIQVSALDTDNRRKVLALRDRLEAAKNATPKVAAVNTTGTPGQSVSAGSNTDAVSIPTPTEIYSGSANTNRIGLLIPLSGKYQVFGERVQRAVKLAFEDRTDLEIIAQDAGENLATSMAALQNLVEQHQVVAIIGPILTVGIETLVAKAAYYQVPMISLAQSGPTAEHFYTCAVSPKDQVKRIVQYAMDEQALKRFAILAPENRSGQELAFQFWTEVEAKNGEIRGFETYSSKETDFRHIVDPILGLTQTEDRAEDWAELARKRAEDKITKRNRKTEKYYTLKPIQDFDAVFIADEARTVGQIIPTFAYRDADKIQWLGISSWNSNALVQRAADLVEGAVFPTAFQTVRPSKATKEFLGRYESTLNMVPTEMEALAFDGAQMLKSAMKQDSSSRLAVSNALRSQTHVVGATGEIEMQNQACIRDLKLLSVKKGRIVSAN